MERPEMYLTTRSETQRLKDVAALEVAKEQEAERLKNGATYKRINNRTIVLKEKPNENRI